MRTVDDGKKEKRKKRKEKIIVATNVVASWPPDRRPTGTPHACAKIHNGILLLAPAYHICYTVFLIISSWSILSIVIFLHLIPY